MLFTGSPHWSTCFFSVTWVLFCSFGQDSFKNLTECMRTNSTRHQCYLNHLFESEKQNGHTLYVIELIAMCKSANFGKYEGDPRMSCKSQSVCRVLCNFLSKDMVLAHLLKAMYVHAHFCKLAILKTWILSAVPCILWASVVSVQYENNSANSLETHWSCVSITLWPS